MTKYSWTHPKVYHFEFWSLQATRACFFWYCWYMAQAWNLILLHSLWLRSSVKLLAFMTICLVGGFFDIFTSGMRCLKIAFFSFVDQTVLFDASFIFLLVFFFAPENQKKEKHLWVFQPMNLWLIWLKLYKKCIMNTRNFCKIYVFTSNIFHNSNLVKYIPPPKKNPHKNTGRTATYRYMKLNSSDSKETIAWRTAFTCTFKGMTICNLGT